MEYVVFISRIEHLLLDSLSLVGTWFKIRTSVFNWCLQIYII
jgi:hypothetical protein